MEVAGRRSRLNKNVVFCKPCEDREISTRTDGFCNECKEHICRTCFDTHKQFKVSRRHTFTGTDVSIETAEDEDEFEKCKQHINEKIKFYCPQHDQVGCGDCMILEHKTCKVEYIRDKARTFKDSLEFRELVKGAEKVHTEAKQMLSSVKNNKVQVRHISEKFIQDVIKFKQEMMSHVTKLTNAMLKQGKDMKSKDIRSMDELEKENETLLNEILRLTQQLEPQDDEPQKLFVSSILLKPKLHQFRRELDNIKGKNKIEVYKFKRDVNLERSIKDSIQLGSLQTIKPRNETDEQEVRPKKPSQVAQASVPTKPQPLLDRQLICRNITLDGEYLSYADNGSGDVGLYVDKNRMRTGSCLEVEILSLGQRGTIAIGLVPKNHPENRQPGCGNDSIGYHADNGRLYHKSLSGVRFGPACNDGDRIECRLSNYGLLGMFHTVVFTRNGNKIGEKKFMFDDFIYAAIGMHSAGEKVKVILHAKMP